MFNILQDINEKFYKTDFKNVSKNYFDALHAIVMGVVREFTEEDFNSVPAPLRLVVNNLDKDILQCCSQEYQNELKEYIEKNGKFHKKIKDKAKSQRLAGFIVDAGEGLNI